MELFREWFFWTESNLFVICLVLIVFSFLLPWKPGQNRGQWIVLIFSLAFYAVCEIFLSLVQPASYMAEFFCLLLGGFFLSMGIGRLLKLLWMALRKR